MWSVSACEKNLQFCCDRYGFKLVMCLLIYLILIILLESIVRRFEQHGDSTVFLFDLIEIKNTFLK